MELGRLKTFLPELLAVLNVSGVLFLLYLFYIHDSTAFGVVVYIVVCLLLSVIIVSAFSRWFWLRYIRSLKYLYSYVLVNGERFFVLDIVVRTDVYENPFCVDLLLTPDGDVTESPLKYSTLFSYVKEKPCIEELLTHCNPYIRECAKKITSRKS